MSHINIAENTDIELKLSILYRGPNSNSNVTDAEPLCTLGSDEATEKGNVLTVTAGNPVIVTLQVGETVPANDTIILLYGINGINVNGTFMVKNRDAGNRTFELYETDGTTATNETGTYAGAGGLYRVGVTGATELDVSYISGRIYRCIIPGSADCIAGRSYVLAMYDNVNYENKFFGVKRVNCRRLSF